MGRWGDEQAGGRELLAEVRIPNSKLQTPNSKLQTLNFQCPMPDSLFPISC